MRFTRRGIANLARRQRRVVYGGMRRVSSVTLRQVYLAWRRPIIVSAPPNLSHFVMAAEIATAFASIKAAATIARGMNSLNNRTEVNQAVIDIQQHLLDTQQTVALLQDQIEEYKGKIRELESFSPERFVLAPLVHDGHRYSGRQAYQEAATGAFFCPGCFANKTLTPVQFGSDGTWVQGCKTCSTNLGWSDDHRVSV